MAPIITRKKMRHFPTILLASALIITAMDTVAKAQAYSEIVAFGASLTDGGNVLIASPDILGYAHPPSPPNYEGRFSNGPSWLDFLADRIGVRSTGGESCWRQQLRLVGSDYGRGAKCIRSRGYGCSSCNLPERKTGVRR